MNRQGGSIFNRRGQLPKNPYVTLGYLGLGIGIHYLTGKDIGSLSVLNVNQANSAGGGKTEGETTSEGESPDSASAADKAKELGYDRKVKDPPFNPHGQPVFTNGKDFITPDADQHNGGEWKGFDRRGNRTGTYDGNLDRIGK